MTKTPDLVPACRHWCMITVHRQAWHHKVKQICGRCRTNTLDHDDNTSDDCSGSMGHCASDVLTVSQPFLQATVDSSTAWAENIMAECVLVQSNFTQTFPTEFWVFSAAVWFAVVLFLPFSVHVTKKRFSVSSKEIPLRLMKYRILQHYATHWLPPVVILCHYTNSYTKLWTTKYLCTLNLQDNVRFVQLLLSQE